MNAHEQTDCLGKRRCDYDAGSEYVLEGAPLHIVMPGNAASAWNRGMATDYFRRMMRITIMKRHGSRSYMANGIVLVREGKPWSSQRIPTNAELDACEGCPAIIYR